MACRSSVLTSVVLSQRLQLAAPAPAHADPPPCAGEPSDDGRFGQPLGVDGRVEVDCLESISQLPNGGGRAEPAARQHDTLVDCRVAFQQICGVSFDRPGQKRAGKTLAERGSDRHTVDHVADSAERTRSIRGDLPSVDIGRIIADTSDGAEEMFEQEATSREL